MGTKKTIRKMLVIGLWLVIAGGMVTLLAAAMRTQKNERCAGHQIVLNKGEEKLFLDESDILQMISRHTGGSVKGQPLASIELRNLEQLLEKNEWIADAEIYFDNKNVLQVRIMERVPVARIFTVTSGSFYIDRNENRMPLSGKLHARLPVFTGFPEKKILAKADSLLLKNIRMAAEFINAHEFWQSQVSQIDITPAHEFEMVPLVGNHIVKLGKGDDVAEKFNRLFIFYKQVLRDAGFDKYKSIDVQYAGQVVATKGYASKGDSIQLRKNVEKLLEQARAMQFDTLPASRNYAPDPTLSAIDSRPGQERNSPADSTISNMNN